jgi:hypothetical protein
MTANELADEFKEENNDWNEDNLRHWGKQAATMLRILDGQLAFLIDAVTKYQAKVEEQQAEIKALKIENSHLKYEISSGAWNPAELTDEEIHQAIRRGFARDGFLSDGIFLEIKELLRNTQGINREQVPDFFFMENDLMGKR